MHLRAAAGPVVGPQSKHNYGHVCIKFVESLGCTPGESTHTHTRTLTEITTKEETQQNGISFWLKGFSNESLDSGCAVPD